MTPSELPRQRDYPRKNAYWCEACHGYVVTVDVDEGVTPMFLACRVKGDPSDPGNDCRGTMRSMMYPAEPWPARDGYDQEIPTDPTWEWYTPDERELKRITKKARHGDQGHAATLEHVQQGGLLLRQAAA